MKIGIYFITLLLLFSFVSATTVFKHNEEVNYKFRCYDSTGQYCDDTTRLIINVEYPNGTNALNNISMTYNETYFNATLPTNLIGDDYKVLIHSSTDNNTITEFPYNVTSTGGSGSMFFIILIFSLATIFFIATLFVNEEFFVYISGVLFLVGGIYLMIYGLDILNDWTTRALSYVTMGLGLLFTLGAYVYNSYNKSYEEDDY